MKTKAENKEIAHDLVKWLNTQPPIQDIIDKIYKTPLYKNNIMTLTQYLNQAEPRKDVKVYLQRDEVNIFAGWYESSSKEFIYLVSIPLLKDKDGFTSEPLVCCENGKELYHQDYYGDVDKISCFELEETLGIRTREVEILENSLSDQVGLKELKEAINSICSNSSLTDKEKVAKGVHLGLDTPCVRSLIRDGGFTLDEIAKNTDNIKTLKERISRLFVKAYYKYPRKCI